MKRKYREFGEDSLIAAADGSIIIGDDYLTTLDTSRNYNSKSSTITARMSSSTELLKRPTYELYWTPQGTKSDMFEQIHEDASDATEVWRDLNLDTKIAKHNMHFARTAEKRIDARYKWDFMEVSLKIAQLKKWSAEKVLKEHKEKARVLKNDKKMEQREQQSLAMIKQEIAKRECQRLQVRAKSRPNTGGRRISASGFRQFSSLGYVEDDSD